MKTQLLALLVAGAFFTASALFAIDSNHNGMSDVWEALYAVPADAADEDFDGDGYTNEQESLLGTDPNDARSRPILGIFAGSTPSELRLRVDTVAGKLYQIETSADLTNWTSLSPIFPGIDGPIDVVETIPDQSVAAGFFRNRYVTDADDDHDGLTAWEENYLGTSDASEDSDGDQMPDGWEYEHGLDPLHDDANQDLDEDGVSNLDEFLQGTDPTDRWNGVPPDYTVLPAAPSDVTANTTSPGNIEVTWKANSNNATAFYIERSLDGDQWTRVGTVDGALRSYVDVTAAPGTAYFYSLIAHN